MVQKIDRSVVEHFGGRKKLDKELKRYRKALEDHGKTEGKPAPTADALIEHLVRNYDSKYEVVEDTTAPAIEEEAPPYPEEPEPVAEMPDEYVPPKESFEEMKEMAFRYLAGARHSRQKQGVSYKGHPISCTPESTAAMVTTLAATSDQPNILVAWKDNNGKFIDFERMDLEAVLKLAHKLTQKCFANERRLIKHIEKAENEQEIQLVDINSGWPS